MGGRPLWSVAKYQRPGRGPAGVELGDLLVETLAGRSAAGPGGQWAIGIAAAPLSECFGVKDGIGV